MFVNANAQSLCGTVRFMHNIIVVMLSIIFASSNKSDKIVTRHCYKAPASKMNANATQAESETDKKQNIYCKKT